MKDTVLINYQMFQQLSISLHKYESIWENNPMVVSCVAKLDAYIKDISNANVKFIKTNNLTIGKKSFRKSITNQAFLIKDNMRLYYRSIDNIEEMQLLTYPITKLNKMTDSDFYQEVSDISEKSFTLTTELLPYRVTLIMLNKLKTDLLKLKTYKPKRTLLSQTNANIVKFIPEKTDACRLMIKNSLDTLIHSYEKDDEREFVINYDNSRERHLLPGSRKHYTIVIYGNITDEITSNILANINISAGKKMKLTITDVNGNYAIKIYTKDADYITFSHPEYQTQIIEIKLIEPEKHKKATYTINVVMVRNISPLFLGSAN